MRAGDSLKAAPASLGRFALLAALLLSAVTTFSCGEEKPSDSWVPPADPCGLPYAPGEDCTTKVDVWSYESGACVKRVFAGCKGNANNFPSQEECIATCEGRPAQRACTGGRVAHDICLSCATTGGCNVRQQLCGKPCTTDMDCADVTKFKACVAGFCQIPGC